MRSRVATAGQLVREAHVDFRKLALLFAATIAATTALAVAARYLPSTFPLRARVISGTEWVAFAAPVVLFISCLGALWSVARGTGEFQWPIWTITALVTGVWPFVCLMAAMIALGGADALNLSPRMQRTFHLAAILPAIQVSCWSVAAAIGRLL